MNTIGGRRTLLLTLLGLDNNVFTVSTRPPRFGNVEGFAYMCQWRARVLIQGGNQLLHPCLKSLQRVECVCVCVRMCVCVGVCIHARVTNNLGRCNQRCFRLPPFRQHRRLCVHVSVACASVNSGW